ncbi:MAG: lipid A export permease/ATP-binding protein MsbA [Steroidobacteraceae bacterium]
MSQSIETDSATQVYKRLLGYARRHLGRFAIGVVGMVLFALTDTAFAWLVKEFLNGAFVERNLDILWFVPAGIVALFFLRGLGDYTANYFPGWVGRQVIRALRGELFAKYLRLPVSYHDNATSAQLLSRLTYNTELVAEAATNALTVLIRDLLSIVGLFGWLFYLNWQLTAVVLAIAPVIAWLIQRINRQFRRYSTRIQNSMGDVTRVAKEALEATRLIKVANAQTHEQQLFAAANELNRHTNTRLIGAKAMANPVVQLVAAAALAGVLHFAIRQVLDHTMPVGDFMSYLTALLMVTAPLRRLVNVAGPIQQGIAAGQSIFSILDEKEEPEGGSLGIDRCRGDIEFRAVDFSYDGDKGKALHGVNLAVTAGSTVAIVGRSGSGKSTLVSLLPRFYDPVAGQILLDGVDIQDYQLADLRSQFALVTQDVVLFNDSIRANIAFNLTGADDAAIESAARAAHVMEFVADLPQGLDTMVGDKGVLLSGGQRQRISIARAIVKQAPVLILDEATSALDSESERRIQEALSHLMSGRTTFVIAHRLSTIEQADLIVVMHEGRIVEQGGHADLLARNNLYAQLHRLQFAV